MFCTERKKGKAQRKEADRRSRSEADRPNFSKLSDPCRMQNQSRSKPPPTHTHSPCSPYIQHYRMPFPTWKVFVYFSLRFVDFAFFSRGSLSCPKERSKSVQIVTKLRAKYVWNASAQWHDRRRVILTLQAVIVQHQSQYREKRCWLWRSNDGVVQTAAVKKTVNLY